MNNQPLQPSVIDHIIISRIALFAYHGVHTEEATLGQRFFVSLDIGLDLREAGRNDDYNRTVCYGGMTQLVHEVSTSHRFATIEGLAEAIAAAVLTKEERVLQATVRIEKPSAPVPAIIDGVAVEITRTRADIDNV